MPIDETDTRRQAAPHTPAPWTISKGAYGAIWAGPAQLPHPGKESLIRRPELLAQRDADAALIAAAPDMLNALRFVRDELNSAPEEGRWLGEVVRAAIAKAEGR